MAKSLTARFGLQRWSADGDTQDRSEFDNDNAQVESLAAIFRRGVASARGSASQWARSFYRSDDTKTLDYSDGTAWRRLMTDVATPYAVNWFDDFGVPAPWNSRAGEFWQIGEDLVVVRSTLQPSATAGTNVTQPIRVSLPFAGVANHPGLGLWKLEGSSSWGLAFCHTDLANMTLQGLTSAPPTGMTVVAMFLYKRA